MLGTPSGLFYGWALSGWEARVLGAYDLRFNTLLAGLDLNFPREQIKLGPLRPMLSLGFGGLAILSGGVDSSTVKTSSSVGLLARAPLALAFPVGSTESPFELSIEVAPSLSILPAIHFGVMGGLGLSYWF